jgi:lipid-A-disaccharide synthase-like uncharacterized protein
MTQFLLTYADELLQKFRDPWVWFGFAAQGLFFFRFFWQWLVSEFRRRSTIPKAFWYFSIAGAVCTFIYAAQRREPVFMLPQLLAIVFYTRNLMLIRGEAARRRRAGLPVGDVTEVEIMHVEESALRQPRN